MNPRQQPSNGPSFGFAPAAPAPGGPGAVSAVWGVDPRGTRSGLSVVGSPRKAPTYRAEEEKELAVAEMRDLRDLGHLCAETRAPIAERLNVTDRTLRNWLRDADSNDPGTAGEHAGHVGRRQLVLEDDVIDARAGFASDSDWYYWWLARAMQVNQLATVMNGEDTVIIPEAHRTTVIRALHRQTSGALLAGLRGGEKAVAGSSARFDVDHVLGDTWQVDLTYLPVLVRLTAGGRAFRPGWLVAREPDSGRIMAETLLAERPTAATVAAVIGQGLKVTQLPDGTPLPPPRQVRLDNAGEHVSDELAHLLGGVGISVSLNTDSYASWQNGSIERFFGIAKTDFVSHIPGNRMLGLKRNGADYVLPNGDAVAFNDVQKFLTNICVPYYNQSEHSDARDGLVPDQVWVTKLGPDAPEPRRRPAPALVATLAEVPTGRRATSPVTRNGVNVDTRALTGTCLASRIGRKVQVRRWPNKALAYAEAFDPHTGDFLGTVVEHTQVTEEERRTAHCVERHTRDRVASAKHKAAHKYGAGSVFATLGGPAASNTALWPAGTAPQTAAEGAADPKAARNTRTTKPPKATKATKATKASGPEQNHTPATTSHDTAVPGAAGNEQDWLFQDGEASA